MSDSQISFEEIVLNRKELYFLKLSVKGKIPLDKCLRLKSLHLVDEELHGAKGRMPVSTGMAEINEKGVSYLAYIKRRNSEFRSTRLIAVIALIISILSLVAQVAISLWTQ